MQLYQLLKIPVVMMSLVACLISAARADDPVRVACVGDSITFGAGIEGRETKSYPVRLQGVLGGGFQVTNFGHSGTTAQRQPPHPYTQSYWKMEEFIKASAFTPDVVVLMLGTNDYWQPQNWARRDEFAADYKAMIAHFSSLPSHPTIVLCTLAPPYEATDGLAERHRECVEDILRVAGEGKFPVVRVDLALAGHPEWFPDGCHPDALGAGAIAEAVSEMLKH